MIDTSLLIQIERRSGSAHEAFEDLPVNPFVSAMSVSELLTGAYLADTESRRDKRRLFLENVLRQTPVIPFGEREARVHARLRTELRAAGTPIGAADLIIAATALANGHDLLTRNVREFRQVPGLRVFHTELP